MRKIKDLLIDYKQVLVYLGVNEKTTRDFEKEVRTEGFTFINSDPVSSGSIRSLMSVTRDGKMGFVSPMVWCQLNKGSESIIKFRTDDELYNAPRVDYWKYHNGDEEYLINNPE